MGFLLHDSSPLLFRELRMSPNAGRYILPHIFFEYVYKSTYINIFNKYINDYIYIFVLI